MSPPPHLCPACKFALKQLQNHSARIPHHPSLSALRTAAESCVLCSRIQLFQTAQHEDTSTPVKTCFLVESGSGERDLDLDSLRLRAATYHGELDEVESYSSFSFDHLLENFRLDRVRYADDRLRIPGYSPDAHTGSDGCLELAKIWLQRCELEHTSCERPRRTDRERDWCPSRLILIGSINEDLRLLEREDIPQQARYATLSHRWGHFKSDTCLQSTNLEQWKSRLPALTGLKAILDAIDIARRLGFVYIWIDSLCIMQDSAEDWRRECALMSSVYKYSALNVSAASARDNSEGCFWERDNLRHLPLRLNFGDSEVVLQSPPVPLQLQDEHEQNAIESQILGPYELHDDQTWIWDVSDAPLNSRGWVLQERLLTPRVLNFTSSQLYWECNELQASESYPHQFPEEAYANVHFKKFNPFNIPFHVMGDCDELILARHRTERRLEAFKVWANAVHAFTLSEMTVEHPWTENLTVPSDKLVAISAIARELKPHINSDYLAGHWRAHLERQLGWFGRDYSSRPPIYRAPSWSWASVHGRIGHFHNMVNRYHEDGVVSLIEILDAQTELVGPDEMGQVKGGFLQLRGQLFELDIEMLDSARFGKGGGAVDKILYRGEKTKLHALRDDEENGFQVPCRLFCLPLEICVGIEIEFSALLLGRVEGAESYRRVGYLGPNITDELTTTDVDEDPVLRALGTVDWKERPDVRFQRSRDDLVELIIV